VGAGGVGRGQQPARWRLDTAWWQAARTVSWEAASPHTQTHTTTKAVCWGFVAPGPGAAAHAAAACTPSQREQPPLPAGSRTPVAEPSPRSPPSPHYAEAVHDHRRAPEADATEERRQPVQRRCAVMRERERGPGQLRGEGACLWLLSVCARGGGPAAAAAAPAAAGTGGRACRCGRCGPRVRADFGCADATHQIAHEDPHNKAGHQLLLGAAQQLVLLGKGREVLTVGMPPDHEPAGGVRQQGVHLCSATSWCYSKLLPQCFSSGMGDFQCPTRFLNVTYPPLTMACCGQPYHGRAV